MSDYLKPLDIYNKKIYNIVKIKKGVQMSDYNSDYNVDVNFMESDKRQELDELWAEIWAEEEEERMCRGLDNAFEGRTDIY
jgi:hypothetical protein